MREAFKMGLVKRIKGGEHHLSKRVNQYDLKGNLIKQWRCIRDINRELNYASTNISRCCKRNLRTAYGYIWRYAEENEFMKDK